jgi:DNA-binding response OmpR family regulator
MTSPRTTPRILVAEDDAEMRWLIVETLRGDGYDVIAVSDGDRLLNVLAQDGKLGAKIADLVVSDVRMPSYNGIQVLEQLRAGNWTIPFILMTAFGDEATRKRAESLGAVLFDKPFDLGELRHTVGVLLRGAL